jgi:hypothetical protein
MLSTNPGLTQKYFRQFHYYYIFKELGRCRGEWGGGRWVGGSRRRKNEGRRVVWFLCKKAKANASTSNQEAENTLLPSSTRVLHSLSLSLSLFLSLSLILFLSFLLLLLIARTWSSKGREKTGGREFVDRRGWLLTLTRPTFAPSPLLADAHTCLTFLVLFLRLFLYLFFAFCIFIALQCLAHAQLQRCTYLCWQSVFINLGILSAFVIRE